MRPGSYQGKAYFRNHIQGLYSSRFRGRAAVLNQERKDGPLSDAQRFGSSIDCKEQNLRPEDQELIDDDLPGHCPALSLLDRAVVRRSIGQPKQPRKSMLVNLSFRVLPVPAGADKF